MTTLQSRAYARILDLVSEGEIEGLVNGAKSIYLDGTPLQNADGSFNFENVTYDTRTGTNAQTYIPGTPGVESETTVNTEVKASAPVVRTISDADVDAVRVTVSVPALYFQNSKGDIEGQSVGISIDVQPNGGSYSEVISDVISGKTTSKYQRSYRVQLSGPPPWNIRLRRWTDDTTNPRLQNKTFWDSFTAIIDNKLRYPNSALVSMRFDASTFSGVPTRSYELKLKKVQVPVNYDPITRVYTGTWNGTFQTAWTDNPAWCFYDLVTSSRYGLGEFIDPAQVDKWALYAIGQYCDELVDDGLGGTEPRFTCNLYLQSRAEAYKVVQDMASCFRSMVYWASGSLTLAQDAPSDPVALFTQSNVIDGAFSYSGSAAKARHTVALVTWNDPEDLYAQKVEYVEDQEAIARFGVVPAEVVAIGCTSRGQAARVGRWLLYSERYESETVTFQTGIEGAVARPGQVIKVADASRAGVRLGGRVRTATRSAITIDATVSLGGLVWTLYAMLPDGTVAQSQVESISGSTVNLATLLADAPQPGAQWIMSTSNVQAQTFRVLTVVEQDGGVIEITALKHDPDKYDAVENGLVLQTRDITELTPVPPTPTQMVVSESLYTYQAEVRAALNIGWANVQGATAYRVQWSKDGTNFSQAITSVSDYDVLDITPGTFEVRVYAVGPTGKESANYASATIVALGKTAPPANVTSLQAVIDPSIGITLTWDKVADLDLDGYEINDGPTVLGVAKTTSFKVGLLPTGTKTYSVRALDTSGKYSATAATTSITITPPATPTLTASLSGDAYVLSWNDVAGTLSTSNYIVRHGASFATGTAVATVNGNRVTVPINWAGARTFWVAAVDAAGTVGSAGSAATDVATAGAPTVAAQFAGENVILTWSAVQGTLPTVEYEVRYGASYAAGVAIGRIKGTALQTRADWNGDRTFWVAAIDSNNNTGTAGSVVATVVAAGAPTVSSAFAGENIVLTWGAVQGTMPTDAYEIRFGTTFAGGTSLGTIKGTSFSTKAQWSGARTFWVAAVDINGTTGTAGSTSATVNAPTPVTVTQEVIDNNVLLKWGDATATLPVDFYELRKGSIWATATFIGRISSRFSAIFESAAGTYTYWVAGYDVAGNIGAQSSVTAQVNQPPDYVLQYDQNSTLAGTRTNIAQDLDDSLLMPVSTTETWQSHFTSRSWNTPQDQINAGFPIYAQPSQTSGSYEEIFDYGTVLASTKITTTLTYDVVSGTPVVTPTISVRKLATDPWTDYAGLSSVFVTDFRYVRVRYDVSSTGGDDLIDIIGLNVRFDVKLKNDAGSIRTYPSQSATYSQTGTAITVTFTDHGRQVGELVDMDFTSGTAADGQYVITSVAANTFTVTSATSATTSGNVTLDPTGTPAAFNVSFVDVQSITVTPGGTSASIAVYNFVDVQNPTGFKILQFNTSGTRIAGTVGWSVKGV
jgi:predicted phage tail protein